MLKLLTGYALAAGVAMTPVVWIAPLLPQSRPTSPRPDDDHVPSLLDLLDSIQPAPAPPRGDGGVAGGPNEPVWEDAVSREYSFLNESAPALEFSDAVSREYSFLNEPAPVLEFSDAVSREYSFQNETTPATVFSDAISREYSFQNGFERPDLQVANLTAATPRYAGQRLNVNWTVANLGPGIAAADWLDRVYLSNDDVFNPAPAGADALAVQETRIGEYAPDTTYSATASLVLPDAPGPLWIFVQTDAVNALVEEHDDNNVAALPITVLAPEYTATVEADLESEPVGTPVTLTGRATRLPGGGPAANVPVDIRLVLRDARRIFPVQTDGDGNFSFVFHPLPREAGVYQVSADHPAVEDAAPEDTFTLHGLVVDRATLPLRLVAGRVEQGTFSLQNLGTLPLTGLQATINGLPAGVTLQLSTPAGLPPLSTVPVPYTALATNDHTPTADLTVQFATAQGATAALAVPLTIPATLPRLEAAPAPLSAAMVRGEQTLVEFEITNTGGVATGVVTVDLPAAPWLSLATPATMAPISAGGTAAVVLLLSPAADLPLGPYTGTIGVSDARASVSVAFTFRAVSTARGRLRVTATDEATYFDAANGFPNVAGAVLELRDPFNEAVVAGGVTGANGQYLFEDIAEGRYELHASAPQHGVARLLVDVVGDAERPAEAFLLRDYVRYSWSVVPTPTPDRYRIDIDALFETYVPAPYLDVTPRIVDLRNMAPGELRTVMLTITNIGFTAAYGASVSVHGDAVAGVGGGGGGHPDYDLDPTVADLGDVPPGASITVPVAVRAANPLSSDPPCFDIRVEVGWEYVCNVRVRRFVVVPFLTPDADCAGSPVTYCCGGAGGGGGGGGGGEPREVPHLQQYAVPCAGIECARALVECGLGVTGGGCPIAVTHCLEDEALGEGVTLDCLKGLGTCGISWALDYIAIVFPIARPIATALDLLLCWHDISEKCRLNLPWPTPGIDPFAQITVDSDDPLVSYFVARANRAIAFFALLRELFGDIRWFQVPLNYPDDPRLANWMAAFDAASEASSEGGRPITATERQAMMALPLPPELPVAAADSFLDRWNRTIDYWDAGIFIRADVPPGMSDDFIQLDRLQAVWGPARDALRADADEGFQFPGESATYALRVLSADRLEVREGVCAHVRIRISQEAVLTRTGFTASLELENAGAQFPLENVLAEILIRDEDGANVPERFDLRPPFVTGGLGAVDGTQHLAPGANMAAAWTIVPGDDAAPTESRRYWISGRLAYRMNGEEVLAPLYPVAIDVLPNASLTLKYFLEKIVYSDDPFTTTVIEPARPFALGVIVHNDGAGVAQDMHITSAQPRIVDNRDGLPIGFTIIGTQVGSDLLSPSLRANFGDVEPQETVSARWLMTATFQGEFVEYSARYEHLDGLGDPRFSIFDGIEIHEMLHSVRADWPTDDRKPDFLANDTPDLLDLPDRLHTSTNEVLPVHAVIDATTDGPVVPPSDFDVLLTADCAAGWNYIRAADPGLGQYRLARVRRPDGTVVRGGDNAWTTSRIVRLQQPPDRLEQFVHVFDYAPAAGVRTYRLHYTTSVAVVPGDVNCDGGSVDNFDIDAFVLAISNEQQYEATYPWCDIMNADINQDGLVNNFDIDAFIDLLNGG